MYVHLYSNEYIVAEPRLKIHYRGHTIDTITRSQIKLAHIKNQRITTFEKPPLTVNSLAATDGAHLYVNSMLPGQFEETSIWKNASIIDMYDLDDKSYLSSFYVYNVAGQKMRSFIVEDHQLFALAGTQLVRYRLKGSINIMRKK